MAIFLDTFKGGRDRFKDSMAWIQNARLWWVNTTRPSKGFIIAEVGRKGIT